MVVALMAVLAMVVGPLVHRPLDRRPWAWTTLAGALFVVGLLVRPWAVAQSGPVAATADVFTMSGYAALLTGLLIMVLNRGRLERFALADGATVCLGALGIALVLFAMPAARIEGRAQWVSVLAGLYPVLDVLVVLVMLNLGFTTAAGSRSYRAMCVSISALIVGDLGYAWIGAEGQLVGPPILNLPFVVAYTFYAAAALHPSMTSLSSPVPVPVQEWSWRRLALLVPALAAPPVLLIVLTDVHHTDRVILALTALATTSLLVHRVLAAVRAHVRAEKVLRERASRDPLTGLLNRQALQRGVEDLLATGHVADEVWAVAVDLDNFRFVNDTWGHGTGDQLIVQVARRLQAALPVDSPLARTGGDEFVVVAEGRREQVVALAEGLGTVLREPIEVDGMEFVLTASLGIASAQRRGSAVDLLRDADTAMSGAKVAGKDRHVVFDQAMRDGVRDRLEIELALRYAVQRGQFWVAYQPLIDIEGGHVLGCEALLRWDHPTRGAVSPAVFIPVAEETGLINELGAWVLGEAARQVAQWQRDGVVGADFFVSVNVSARQLGDGSVLGTVASVLQHTGLPAPTLVLEITESAMLAQPEQTLLVLHRLRELGVGLSLDDFGTGYSSLSYLSRLPVTTVKLDRSFVDKLDAPDADLAIVHAVEAISRAMRLKLVAEGVETEGQRQALSCIGVPVGQGWLWGAAVDPGSFRDRWGAAAPADAGLEAGSRSGVSSSSAA
jgi:diguanylate cyclase (GGDEF)-like protein